MSLIDKLYSELEKIEYKIEQYLEGEIELSEFDYGIATGRESTLNELIDMIESGDIQ